MEHSFYCISCKLLKYSIMTSVGLCSDCFKFFQAVVDNNPNDILLFNAIEKQLKIDIHER